jgi:hypothetical protein
MMTGLTHVSLLCSVTILPIDDSTYDTVFQTVSGVTLILRVHLPPSQHPSAPVQPPSMTLAGVRARHSWLESPSMRVTGYSVINSQDEWNQAFLLLGPAVHQVVTHLQLNPPEILEITDAGLRSIQPKSHPNPAVHAASAATSFPRRPPQYAGATNHSVSAMDAPPDYESLLATPDIDMPKIPTEFEELEPLTREELEELLQGDELEFMGFCNKLPISHTIQSIASSVVDENAVMARANLDREEELNQLHTKVTGLQQQLEKKVKAFQELEQKQNTLIAPPDTRHIMRQLAKAKKQAFDESEQMAEDWLEEGGDVKDFLDCFLEKRRVHHVRAAKLELLQYNNTDNGDGNNR